MTTEAEVTAEALAAELKERGIPLETLLLTGQILLEDDPEGVAKVLGWAMQSGVGLGGFPS